MTIRVKGVNIENFVAWLKANNIAYHMNSKKTIIKFVLNDSVSFDSVLDAYEQNRT